MLAIAFLLINLATAQICIPNAYPPALWKANYPTIYAFNGYFRADGNLQVLDPNSNTILMVHYGNNILIIAAYWLVSYIWLLFLAR